MNYVDLLIDFVLRRLINVFLYRPECTFFWLIEIGGNVACAQIFLSVFFLKQNLIYSKLLIILNS